MQNFIFEAQTNYAHDILDFKYLTEVTETNKPKEDLKAFVSFETLTIKPYEDTLMFEGKLLDLYGNADEKTRANLKKSNDKGLLNKTMAEHISREFAKKIPDGNFDVFAQIYNLVEIEVEEEEEKEREITFEECDNTIAKRIYTYMQKYAEKLEIIDGEDYLLVGAEMPSITFTDYELTKFYLESIDTTGFYIIAIYNEENEEDEKAYGVRFCWEIKK